MYQHWSPPPTTRRQLQQLELKKREIKRRIWQFSASIFLFSFVFYRHEDSNYQHITSYLPQEFTDGISSINGIITREINFYQDFFTKTVPSLVLKSESNTENSPFPTEDASPFSEDSLLVSGVTSSYYEDSLDIFSVQGDLLWTDILEWMEPQPSPLATVSEEVEDDSVDTRSTEVALDPLGEEVLEIGEIFQYFSHELPETHSEHHYYLGDSPSVSPIETVVTSPFGLRIHPLSGEPAIHNGVDLRGSEGTAISAWREGVVSVVGFTSIVGNYVRIDHGDEIYSFYAHCSEISVKKGENVLTGDIIGRVGATGDVTGPHLHFEITYQGIYLNPLHYIEYSSILE